jgi:hypothetical protein
MPTRFNQARVTENVGFLAAKWADSPGRTQSILNIVNHEQSVLRAFILPTMRKRYVEFLATPKRRKKLLEQLAHFKHLDPRFVVEIAPNKTNPVEVARLLAARGAGSNCWVISEASALDGREMDLREALQRTIGYGMGTILSCVPGKLAYFEDEESRCILQRK